MGLGFSWRLAGMAGFFSQLGYKATAEWKEEVVFHDPSRKLEPTPVFPDGTAARLPPDRDPREVFADWLIDPKNPWFTRNIANRVWSWLLGRGIVQEPDDLRPDNPPANPELLALLEQELIAARYDLKHLYRLILNSQTYQRSSIPRTDRPDAEAQFAHYRHLVPAQEFLVSVTGRGGFRVPVRVLGESPVRIPLGGTARVRLQAPTNWFAGQIHLELSEPPAGITIRNTFPTREGGDIELDSDAAKARPGVQGNLIVTVLSGRPAATARPQANPRRNALGTLPAIPFEIVVR